MDCDPHADTWSGTRERILRAIRDILNSPRSRRILRFLLRGRIAHSSAVRPLHGEFHLFSDVTELSVVSLNLGGRNMNPLEFVCDGDETTIGQRATEVRLRAESVMSEVGPVGMAAGERAIVRKIIDAIYRGADHSFVDGLLDAATWAAAYEQVSREKLGLFNSLNLTTLQTGRPAPLEAPTICAQFKTGAELLE